MQTLDPYKVFKVQRGFNLEEVKAKYHKFARQLHPDKNNSPQAVQLFQAISMCYQKLLEDHCMRLSDKQCDQLRTEAREFGARQASTTSARVASGAAPSMADNFDISRFNTVFSENRTKDFTDKGYAKWLRESPANDASAEAQRKKLAVSLYQPLSVHTMDPNTGYQLGETKVQDYGKPVVLGTHKSGLVYSDLRVAHTTTRLVDNEDPTQYRKEFKNVGHLEAERANVEYQMSDKEHRRYVRDQLRTKRHEDHRLDQLRRRDDVAAQQYSRMHELLMGAPAS